MIKALLQSAAFGALPFLVVVIREKDRVFGRDDGRALRKRDDLALHHAFDLAGDLDDEFFGNAARFYLRVAGRLFQYQLRRFAVDPFSDFIQHAHVKSPRKINIIFARFRFFRNPAAGLPFRVFRPPEFDDLDLVP